MKIPVIPRKSLNNFECYAHPYTCDRGFDGEEVAGVDEPCVEERCDQKATGKPTTGLEELSLRCNDNCNLDLNSYSLPSENRLPLVNSIFLDNPIPLQRDAPVNTAMNSALSPSNTHLNDISNDVEPPDIVKLSNPLSSPADRTAFTKTPQDQSRPVPSYPCFKTFVYKGIRNTTVINGNRKPLGKNAIFNPFSQDVEWPSSPLLGKTLCSPPLRPLDTSPFTSPTIAAKHPQHKPPPIDFLSTLKCFVYSCARALAVDGSSSYYNDNHTPLSPYVIIDLPFQVYIYI